MYSAPPQEHDNIYALKAYILYFQIDIEKKIAARKLVSIFTLFS